MEKRVSKLSITKDDTERRENLAKRLNRNATNRLRQQHEQFQDNHEFIETEINHEIKRLKHDLKGIREIGSYELANTRNSKTETNEQTNKSSIGTKRKRKKLTLFQKTTKSSTRRRLNADDRGTDVKSHFENSSQLTSVENNKTAGNNLSNLWPNHKHTKKSQAREVYSQHDITSAAHETRFNEHGVYYERQTKSDAGGTQLVGQKTKFYEHEKEGTEHEIDSSTHETLPYITQNGTQDSTKSRELDLDKARNQARKRLLGENGRILDVHNNESNTQADQGETIDEDIESYMYVPPDGRKRTVYLLPPLNDLLQEARKARYLRMPKRLMNHDEDPERELSVDEIFGKSI